MTLANKLDNGMIPRDGGLATLQDAICNDDISKADCLVLAALHEFSLLDGEASATLECLAHVTALNRRTVRRATKKLAQRGLIVLAHAGGGRHLPNRWRINYLSTKSALARRIASETDIRSARHVAKSPWPENI